jgi:hypothetical protein
MHIELAPRRREPVLVSGRWRRTVDGLGEVRPSLCNRIEDQKIIQINSCSKIKAFKRDFRSNVTVKRGLVNDSFVSKLV